MPKLKSKKGPKVDTAADENVLVGSKQLLASAEDQTRRKKHIELFDELLEVTQDANRSLHITSPGKDEVPTLLVGYIARAMGLNLSNEQVLNVVEMVEEKEAASRGYVPAAPLKEIIVEALMSGVLVPPKVPAPPLTRKATEAVPPVNTVPVSVVRDSEEKIYQAFRVLDMAKRGYLEAEEMRHFLRRGDEPFTEEEVEEFMAAAADPENGRIYYEDYADVLATE